MNDYNKILWFLFIVALNGLISLLIKKTESKVGLTILMVLFILLLLIVSISWTFFSFWR